jgi:hypothetical protein
MCEKIFRIFTENPCVYNIFPHKLLLPIRFRLFPSALGPPEFEALAWALPSFTLATARVEQPNWYSDLNFTKSTSSQRMRPMR